MLPRVPPRHPVPWLAAALLAAGCETPARKTYEDYARGPTKTYVQGHFGGSSFDEELAPSTDSESLPAVGFAAQVPVRTGRLELGWEVGFLFGWEFESRNVSDATGVAKVDDELLWGDLFTGAFAAWHLGRARLYVSGGPQLSLAYFERSGDRDLDARGHGFGGYVRTGVDLRLSDEIWMGVAVRGVTSDLDYDQDAPDVDLDALQGFITMTVHF